MIQTVTFKHSNWNIAAHLHLPAGFAAEQSYAAIVCVHPGSSCKDQTAGLYAAKLAEQGFVALAFDALYQGDSEGEPRFTEDPAARVEDIRCAVDYLLTLPFVDAQRIGVLGICAGGGYAVNAAMTETRIKAVGTVVGANIGRLYREGDGAPDSIARTLEAIAEQRTQEVRGSEALISHWIPCSAEALEAAGIADIDLVQAVDYYTTPRGQHACSPNQLRFTSIAKVMAFDAFHLLETLLRQPLQIIIGSEQGGFGSYRDGQELFQRAQSEKDLYIVEGASHYDLYDRPAAVNQAIIKLTDFYRKHLAA